MVLELEVSDSDRAHNCIVRLLGIDVALVYGIYEGLFQACENFILLILGLEVLRVQLTLGEVDPNLDLEVDILRFDLVQYSKTTNLA